MAPLVSALLIVRDEEANLGPCLQALAGLADEVIVVDGESSDRTVEVARAHGAKVFVRPPRGVIDEDRPFGFSHCTGEYVLHIDADEVFPAPLAAALRKAAEDRLADVVEAWEDSWFMGEVANVWAGHKPRLFRRTMVDVRDQIHGMYQPRPGATRALLPDGPGMRLQHYWTDGIGPLVAKLGRYTATQAAQAGPAQPRGLGRRAARAFLGAYLRDGGWRRGWRGTYLSLHRAFYEATVEVRRAELALGGGAAIRDRYRQHAAGLVATRPVPPTTTSPPPARASGGTAKADARPGRRP